jgi:hypothetical protein
LAQRLRRRRGIELFAFAFNYLDLQRAQRRYAAHGICRLLEQRGGRLSMPRRLRECEHNDYMQ